MTGDTNPTTPAAVEWTAAELEAVVDAMYRSGRPLPHSPADILDALAPFVADRERQAAARAWGEGYDAATTMARCWGHTDYWEGEPSNPYEADRIGREGQP